MTARQRLLIGRECLSLQGIPWQKVVAASSFSEVELRHLAGNAFASPCVLAILHAAFHTVCWTPQKQADPEEQLMLDRICASL